MTQDTEHAVRLTRTFDVAREHMWKMWTDPTEFAGWYGPEGATVEVDEMDVRPGGRRSLSMEVETPTGLMRMEFTGEYREVLEARRLVYTEATDGHLETVVEVEFHDHGGRTTVVLVHHGIPAGSPGASGWAMALDALAVRVASM